MAIHLPRPSETELKHSEKLQLKIQHAITCQKNQCLSFASFMQMALYEPSLGYYVAGLRKFGEQGDFVTAPEISPVFSHCLASQCEEVLLQLNQKNILEFGAGSGIMAAEILLALEQQGLLLENYFILEVSPDLTVRQQALIQKKCPHLFHLVSWLSALPQDFIGIVLANEVLDAMPVHLFEVENHQAVELGVSYQNNQFFLSKMMKNTFNSCLPRSALTFEDGYCSELCLAIKSWLEFLYQSIKQGVVLLIDYGFPEKEYYHQQRNQGTIMCHYQHHAHGDFFTHIGLQDITAHVDFTRVAVAADEAGFDVVGFTTQADFLLAAGLLALKPGKNPREQFIQTQAIKTLLLPGEMGELFKVIGLSKNIEVDLKGFSGADHLPRL